MVVSRTLLAIAKRNAVAMGRSNESAFTNATRRTMHESATAKIGFLAVIAMLLTTIRWSAIVRLFIVIAMQTLQRSNAFALKISIPTVFAYASARSATTFLTKIFIARIELRTRGFAIVTASIENFVLIAAAWTSIQFDAIAVRRPEESVLANASGFLANLLTKLILVSLRRGRIGTFFLASVTASIQFFVRRTLGRTSMFGNAFPVLVPDEIVLAITTRIAAPLRRHAFESAAARRRRTFTIAARRTATQPFLVVRTRRLWSMPIVVVVVVIIIVMTLRLSAGQMEKKRIK